MSTLWQRCGCRDQSLCDNKQWNERGDKGPPASGLGGRIKTRGLGEARSQTRAPLPALLTRFCNDFVLAIP